MATLTYDPTEYQEGEFSAEEQESLEIGEQLAAEQEQLLAGKFKDAQDLENAYIELQKKLGDPEARSTEQEQPTEEVEEEEDDEESEEISDFLERLWEESQTEEYSEETIKKLSEMEPVQLAEMYLDYRNNQQTETLSDEDVSALKDVAGGEQEYANMVTWAANNMTEDEVELYDAVMEKGDPAACFFAVQALKYRYQDANGYEGELLTGSAPRNQADVFRSQAEVVRAMSDPRYDSDPAYRQDVFNKLERSELNY